MTLAGPKKAADPGAKEAGILPAHVIERLIAQGGLAPGAPLLEGQIQPASLDLRLGETAYRVRASFLPGAGVTVAEKLDELALHAFDLRDGAVLETGCVYIVPLLESLALPETLSAGCNPKSSTGRLDVFTRIITDGARAFDQIAAGYAGPLYAEICPQTFAVVGRTGSRPSQIRFRAGEARHDDDALVALHREQALVSDAEADIEGGIALSVDLCGDPETGLVGYRAKRHTGLVDVDVAGACKVLDYWEPIHSRGETQLILDPDQFYILASREAVTVPPSHAAEMIPFNPLVGEFRVHYAGFFDPGFGHADAGGAGSKAVLEVRSHKVPFILEDGQIVGRLVYEKLTEPPEQLYGQGIGSHYQAQGLKLSKHFTEE
jgi:dCTP deaminase